MCEVIVCERWYVCVSVWRREAGGGGGEATRDTESKTRTPTESCGAKCILGVLALLTRFVHELLKLVPDNATDPLSHGTFHMPIHLLSGCSRNTSSLQKLVDSKCGWQDYHQNIKGIRYIAIISGKKHNPLTNQPGSGLVFWRVPT